MMRVSRILFIVLKRQGGVYELGCSTDLPRSTSLFISILLRSDVPVNVLWPFVWKFLGIWFVSALQSQVVFYLALLLFPLLFPHPLPRPVFGSTQYYLGPQSVFLHFVFDAPEKKISTVSWSSDYIVFRISIVAFLRKLSFASLIGPWQFWPLLYLFFLSRLTLVYWTSLKCCIKTLPLAMAST